MAEQLDWSTTTLSRLENGAGRHGYANLNALVKLYGVSTRTQTSGSAAP